MINTTDIPASRPGDVIIAICPDCYAYAAHPVVAVPPRLGECVQCGGIFDETEAVLG